MDLTASQEDYLEAIYRLDEKGGAVRSRDVAACMGVSAPSVHGAVRALVRLRLARHDRYGGIFLTASGRRFARAVSEGHDVFERFFRGELKLAPSLASECACRMEHALPLGARRIFIEYVRGLNQGYWSDAHSCGAKQDRS